LNRYRGGEKREIKKPSEVHRWTNKSEGMPTSFGCIEANWKKCWLEQVTRIFSLGKTGARLTPEIVTLGELRW